MIRLGVNIDHVATLRQARRTFEPDPVAAAFLAERHGADGITIHLREDRRHIQDRDLALLRQTVTVKLNLEMGLAEEILAIALVTRPDQVTFVPERREEITTEGGLDVASEVERIRDAVRSFQEKGIGVSLFIDPDPRQIEATCKTGAPAVEFHTGQYAHASRRNEEAKQQALRVLLDAVHRAHEAGLHVHAGHGLTYNNVAEVAAIPAIEELNIGHSIISRAVFTGLGEAVATMKRLMIEARLRSGVASLPVG